MYKCVLHSCSLLSDLRVQTWQLGNSQVPENCPLGCAWPVQQAVQPHRACRRLPCHRDPLLARMRNGERLWIFHILIMSIDGKPKECCRNCKHNFQDRVLIVILSVIGSVSSGTLVSGLKWENWLEAEFISCGILFWDFHGSFYQVWEGGCYWSGGQRWPLDILTGSLNSLIESWSWADIFSKVFQVIIFNEMPRLLSIVGKYSKILVSVKKNFYYCCCFISDTGTF